jgi:hypothetical protein
MKLAGTFLVQKRHITRHGIVNYHLQWVALLVVLGTSLSAVTARPMSGISSKARLAARAELYAPASAVFRGMETTPLGDACGEIDSRNIEGSRTGFARFIYDHKTQKAALSLHDPDFHQFFVMDDNEYTNGNAALITDDACRFVEKWVATCPSDLARRELHAKALCNLYHGGSSGRSRLKTLVGSK